MLLQNESHLLVYFHFYTRNISLIKPNVKNASLYNFTQCTPITHVYKPKTIYYNCFSPRHFDFFFCNSVDILFRITIMIMMLQSAVVHESIGMQYILSDIVSEYTFLFSISPSINCNIVLWKNILLHTRANITRFDNSLCTVKSLKSLIYSPTSSIVMNEKERAAIPTVMHVKLL